MNRPFLFCFQSTGYTMFDYTVIVGQSPAVLSVHNTFKQRERASAEKFDNPLPRRPLFHPKEVPGANFILTENISVFTLGWHMTMIAYALFCVKK